MANKTKAGIVIVLAIATAVVIASRRSASTAAPASDARHQATTPAAPRPSQAVALPRLVDLGAHQCIPCKMMAPILDELRTELAGQLQVDFIDVWEDPQAGRRYGINGIPTQIFYDAAGKELSRHEGFIGKADILARFREHGIILPSAPSKTP